MPRAARERRFSIDFPKGSERPREDARTKIKVEIVDQAQLAGHETRAPAGIGFKGAEAVPKTEPEEREGVRTALGDGIDKAALLSRFFLPFD